MAARQAREGRRNCCLLAGDACRRSRPTSWRNSSLFPAGRLVGGFDGVIVTQTSVGGSLTAAIEYSLGTFGGAIYAGVVGAMIRIIMSSRFWPCSRWRSPPLALLAAINPHFRVATRSRPFWSLWERPYAHRSDRLGVLSRARGRARALSPARGLLAGAAGAGASPADRAAAEMLDRLAAALPELLAASPAARGRGDQAPAQRHPRLHTRAPRRPAPRPNASR